MRKKLEPNELSLNIDFSNEFAGWESIDEVRTLYKIIRDNNLGKLTDKDAEQQIQEDFENPIDGYHFVVKDFDQINNSVRAFETTFGSRVIITIGSDPYYTQPFYDIASEDCGWISVKDRLPDKDGKYLVCDKGGNVYAMSFAHSVEAAEPFAWIPPGNDEANCFYRIVLDCENRQDVIIKFDATYWMPLPKTPKKHSGRYPWGSSEPLPEPPKEKGERVK